MATFLELAKIKHHAVRSDGAKFLDGERNDSLDTSWLTVDSSGRVTLGPGLYDELLVVKGEVSDDQIRAWASMGAPFYDPTPVIQENQIPSAETWNKAVHDAQRALADAADARAIADGKVTTYYQDTEPIAEALGDLWIHTGEGNKLYRWSGSSWEVVQDKKIQEAVQKAEDAQATADGKIVTFYQSTPPTATAVGDLWVDTDDNDRLYRWDGATWVDITDKSPIDAEKKPVYVKGAGADIDIDKYGIRATRKADGKKTFEIDAETGDAFFKGDITGASGTFQGAVKSVDAEGNYSLLDSGRLSFYRRIGEDDILSYYVAQIATGQAVDGEVVDLEALGYRFFQPPKIVLQPKLNRVFVANAPSNDIWMDWDIEDLTFNPATGAAKFKVRARTIVKGGTVVGSFTPSKLESEGATTVTTTGPGTTFLSFKVSGYAYKYGILDSIRIEFRIQYRKIGTSAWTTLDSRKYSKSALFSRELEILETLSYNVPDSGSTGYEVRVILDVLSLHDPDGSRPKDPHLTILEFSYRSNDTILTDPANPEVVSWIAIDGG